MPFLRTLFTVIVSAVVGFVVARLTKRIRDSRIAYTETTQRVVLDIHEELRKRLKLLYEEQEINQLTTIAVTFENIGTTLILAQTIRIELPESAKILDFRCVNPARELRAELLRDGFSDNQGQVLIGHFDRNQQLQVSIIASSNGPVNIKMYPSNDKDSVALVEKSRSKVMDEREQLTNFIRSVLAYIFLGSLAQHLNTSFRYQLLILVPQILLILYMLRLAYPISRSIASGITYWAALRGNALAAQQDAPLQAASSNTTRRISTRRERGGTLSGLRNGQSYNGHNLPEHQELAASIESTIDYIIRSDGISSGELEAKFGEIREFVRAEVGANSHFESPEEFDRIFEFIFTRTRRVDGGR